MKTLVPLIIIALCIWYYRETHKPEEASAPPPPEAVVAAAPKPAPRRNFYHSPLDAPAMKTGLHSGTGYVSKNHGTNWRGSHLSDGSVPHGVVPDEPTESDDADTPR